MDQRREDMMDDMNRKISRTKSSSSLFVPRASVIRHTKEFKLQSSKSLLFESNPRYYDHVAWPYSEDAQNKHLLKKEEKDSGIDDSFDDEEERIYDDQSAQSGYYDSDQSLSSSVSMDVSSSEERGDMSATDMSATELSGPPPLKFVPNPNIKPTEDFFSRFENLTQEQIVSDFVNCARHSLKEPQLAHLLQLYQHVDQNLLKNTLLKLIRTSNISDNTKRKKEKMSAEEYNVRTNETEMSNPVIDFSVNPSSNKNYTPQNFNPMPEQISSNNTYVPPTPNTFKYSFNKESRIPVAQSGVYIPSIPPTLLRAASLPMNDLQVTTFENKLQCEYCHKKFNNEDASKRHLLTHKGKRTHKCTHCSRSFYEQASYLRHLKSHSGEKAHKCDQCSMAFSKRSALEVHIRTHTGERPFVCKFCGKGFSISGNLHRHVLIHTGHRPYQCGKCPRAFNNPSHLARHISSFHA